MSNPTLQLINITRTYTSGAEKLDVLHGINLTLKPGEVVALVGPSGSGKTTMLQITGLLDTPTSGEVWVSGENVTGASDAKRTLARRNSLGFVYQFHHLLPEFSARENIMLPQMISGTPKAAAAKKADELLAVMGLTNRAEHRPAKLSGGEQQRVAIARALVRNPALLLADEPTGNLDPHTADSVFTYLLKLARGLNLAAIIATHNMELAARLDRVVTLKDGHLV